MDSCMEDIKEDVQNDIQKTKQEIKYPTEPPYIFRTAPIKYATLESFRNDLHECLDLEVVNAEERALGKENKVNWLYTLSTLDELKFVMEEINNTEFPISDKETELLYFRVFEENRVRPGMENRPPRQPRYAGLNRDTKTTYDEPKTDSYNSGYRKNNNNYTGMTRPSGSFGAPVAKPDLGFEFKESEVKIDEVKSTTNDKFLEQLKKDEELKAKTRMEVEKKRNNDDRRRDNRYNNRSNERHDFEKKPTTNQYVGLCRRQ